jgi:transposase
MALDIPNVEVEKVETNKNGDIIITVKSTIEGTRCPRCGSRIKKPYGQGREIDLRHLPIFGKKCYIRIRPPRYPCVHCKRKPVVTQKAEWYDQRSPHTIGFEKDILLQMVNSTIEDVRIKEGLGYEAVMGILRRQIRSKVNWKLIERIGIMGVDEIAVKKGHTDFVTIVTSRTDGKLGILAVLQGREKKTVKKFIKSIPKKLRENIQGVCSDMYEGFVNAAKEVLGENVSIVIDRFHVAKTYRGGRDKLRKKEMERLRKKLSEKEFTKLKGVMWALRKKPEE